MPSMFEEIEQERAQAKAAAEAQIKAAKEARAVLMKILQEQVQDFINSARAMRVDWALSRIQEHHANLVRFDLAGRPAIRINLPADYERPNRPDCLLVSIAEDESFSCDWPNTESFHPYELQQTIRRDLITLLQKLNEEHN